MEYNAEGSQSLSQCYRMGGGRDVQGQYVSCSMIVPVPCLLKLDMSDDDLQHHTFQKCVFHQPQMNLNLLGIKIATALDPVNLIRYHCFPSLHIVNGMQVPPSSICSPSQLFVSINRPFLIQPGFSCLSVFASYLLVILDFFGLYLSISCRISDIYIFSLLFFFLSGIISLPVCQIKVCSIFHCPSILC